MVEFFLKNPIWMSSILLVFCVLLFIVIIIHSVQLSKLKYKYKRLTRGIENQNLESVFHHYLDRMDVSLAQIENISKDINQMNNQLQYCIQKVGIVRYNPFQDVGGDLSFSIALLDSLNTGILITGLYTRNGSTLFSKLITKGTSPSPLSEEEKQAIDSAQILSLSYE